MLRIVLLSAILYGLVISSSGAFESSCKPRGGVKDSILAAECKRWTYGFVEATDAAQLKTLHPNNCDKEGEAAMTCYWSIFVGACNAFVDVAEAQHMFSQDKPFKRKNKKIDDTTWVCSYGWKNDSIDPVTGLYQFQNQANRVTLTAKDYCSIQVSGPYSQCSNSFTTCDDPQTNGIPGFDYFSGQKTRIQNANRAKYNITTPKKYRSDLAGYRYKKIEATCIIQDPQDPTMCIEPEFLPHLKIVPLGSGMIPFHHRSYPQIHHVIPKKDRLTCPCGKNDVSNAVIISSQLNYFFLNFRRPQAEIAAVNAAGRNPYPCR